MGKSPRFLLHTCLWLFLFCLPVSAFGADKVTLQLIWKNQFQFAGYYVARELGFYKDAGLDVTIKEYEFGTDVTADVISRRADFGVGRSSLILEHMEGKPVYLLSAIFQHSPFMLLAKNREDLGDVADLKGKRIMVTDDVVGMASLTAMLAGNGIRPGDFISQKHTFSVDDLINGNTDAIAAYTSNEPFQMLKRGVDYTIFAPKDHGFDFYSDILFTSQKLYQDNPQLVERFIQASLRGWDYAFAHIDEAVDIILKKYNTQNRDREALRFEADTLKKLAYDGVTSLGRIARWRVEQIAQVYRLLGFTNKPLKTDDLFYDQKASARLYLTPEEKSWLEAHRKIVVGGETDWAPFDFVKENGEYAGIADDYLKIIGEKLGIEVEMITGPSWDELLSMLRRKEIDVLPAIYHSEEREAFVHFTTPYIMITEFIFSRSDIQNISSFEDLKDKNIVVVKGYTIEGYLRSNYPDFYLITAPTIQDALKKLVTGEADAFIGDIISTSYNIRKLSLVGIKPIAPVPIEGPKVHMAVRKDWPVLRSLIDKTLKAIPESEHDAIKKQWISFAEKKIDQSRPEVSLTAEEQNWVKQHPVIRVHNETASPPFNFAEHGRPKGFSIDYMRLLAEKIGLSVEFVTGPSWDEFLDMMKAGDLDLMLNIAKTPERQEYLVYTPSYVTLTQTLYTRRDFPLVRSIEDLYGKRIAVPKGFYIAELLKPYPEVKIVEVRDIVEAIHAVSVGKADALYDLMPAVNYLTNKHQITNLKVGGDMGIEAGRPMPLHLAVPRKDAVFAGILAKGMALITDKEFQALSDKWLDSPETAESPIDLTPAPQTAAPISYGRLIGYSIAVFLILSLLTWLLIKTIKKEQIAVHFGSTWFRGLVLAGLSGFVLIVAFAGWYMLERIKTEHLLSVDENLRGVLSVGEDRFESWLEEKISYLSHLGRDPELVAITKRLLQVKAGKGTQLKRALLASSALREARFFFQNTKDIFRNVGFFVINPDHVSIGSMRDANLGARNLISKEHPELLQRAFQGKVGFVPPMTSDVDPGNASKSDDAGRPPTMFFIGPVQDTDGRVLAVMTLRLDPWKDFARALKSFGVSRESYAFDRNGVMLSPSRFEDQLRRIGLLAEDQTSALNIEIRDPGGNMVEGYRPVIERSQQPLTQLASRALALRQQMEKTGVGQGHSPVESNTEGYRDYRGVPVFGAWLWNADLDIGLAVEVDVDEALSHYYRTRVTILSILGFTLVLSVGAILFVLIIGERTSRALMRARDDLEDKVAERTEQLTVAEERSRLLLDSAGEGIFGVDVDGKLAFINPAASRLLGYEPDELIGEGIHAKIHYSHADGTDYPKEACPMYRSYTKGTNSHITDEVLWRKDGSSFSVEYTCMPLKKDGRVVGAVVTFMDIAERKEMETALLAERERLQKILDTSPVGVGIFTEGVVRFANPRFAELFDSKEGEAAQDAYVNPDDRKYIMTELGRSGIVRDRELQTYGRNRVIRDNLATFISTEYEGQPGILAWLVDLSGLKEAEKELKAKFDELARFRRLAIGREQKMIELKKEINELLKENGLSGKYKIH